MRTITISCSLRFVHLVKRAIAECERIGIEAKFPNLEPLPSHRPITLNMMRTFEDDHFRAIRESEALYVIDPDGYVGTLVTVEIGYAKGAGKPVYFSEPAGSLDLDALVSGYVPLGDLSAFSTMKPPHSSGA